MNVKRPLLVFLSLTTLACGGFMGPLAKDVPLPPIEVKATTDKIDPDESADRLPVQADMANPDGKDTDVADEAEDENGDDAGNKNDAGDEDNAGDEDDAEQDAEDDGKESHDAADESDDGKDKEKTTDGGDASVSAGSEGEEDAAEGEEGDGVADAEEPPEPIVAPPPKAEPPPEPAPTNNLRGTIAFDTPVIEGKLSERNVVEVIRRNKGDIKDCYEKELALNANLKGQAVFQLSVDPDGSVSQVRLQWSRLQNENVERCVRHSLKSMSFSAPKGEGAKVTQSMKFAIE